MAARLGIVVNPRFALLLMLLSAFSTAAQVVISPNTAPTVNQGSTFKFTSNVPVIWSMAPGSQGIIDPDGTYHAPDSVAPNQSFGGYQLLPNDHIYNTRIESLPTHSSSATWIAGAGTISVNYLPSFPFNYVNASTPTQSEVFLYSPQNNGTFQVPAYPYAKIEGGWFASVNSPYEGDHHLWAIDTQTGTFQEIYDPSNATQCNAYAGGNSNCTALGGTRYANSTYALPGGAVSDAAGLYMMPLSLHLQEMLNAIATTGTIKHALRFTLQNGYIGFNSFIWPATASSSAGSGVVPFGARFRLKSSFDISSFSPIAQILLTQLKQYGIILADGGAGWQVTIDYAKWPQNVVSAFNEIGAANIGPSNFEAVDESVLELSANSGATATSEAVKATSLADGTRTARQQVVITGVTVGLDHDQLYMQAGAAGVQVNAFVHGSSNTSVTWSMSPTVGTLSGSGLYTPPAISSSELNTTITATSSVNSSVVATMPVTIYPNGSIYIVNGDITNYTDTYGHVWLAGGSCCGGDDGGYPSSNNYGGIWPTVPDITLYEIPFYSFYDTGDMRFDITVPNGTYSITGKFAAIRVNGPGQQSLSLEAQGNVMYSNLDFYALAGYMKPIDFTLPAVVTNGQLSFVIRRMSGAFNNISALQIIPESLSGTTTTTLPAPPTGLNVTVN